MTSYTAADVASLARHLDPLFLAAARHVARHVADDLHGELLVAWCEWLASDREAALALAGWTDSRVFAWAVTVARRIVWRLSREEMDELPEDGGEPVAWQPLARSYDVTDTAPGAAYVLDEQELAEMLHAVAARSAGRAWQVEALDLLAAYDNASPAVRAAIRERLSGLTAAEVGSWRYTEAGRALATAA